MAFILYQKFRQKILIPLRIIPKDGLTPEKLAFSITIGILSGMFPVIGGTTAVGLLLLAIFRQNLVTAQAVSWLMSPFQLVSIIPFMRSGAWILHESPVQITLGQILRAFEPSWWDGLKNLGLLHLYAVLAWALISIPAGFILYYLILSIYNIILRRKLPATSKVTESI